MPSMGLQEWIILFAIVLLIFGPRNLPKVGRAIGQGIREFKNAISGIGSAIEEESEEKPREEKSNLSYQKRNEDSSKDSTPPQG